MKKKLPRRILACLATAVAAALILSYLAAVLKPPHNDYGAVWASYLAEPRDTMDYLYFGSSYAYCDVNPALIYGKSGLTGYVMAGPEQTFSLTYYYLKECLKTQSPSVIFLEASAICFKTYQNYTQVNVAYMPFSANKLGAIFNASEKSLRTGLLFDLYLYHDRWTEVTSADFRRALTPASVNPNKGYTPVEGVDDSVAGGPYSRDESQELYDQNMVWLRKILALCNDRGIRAVVVTHPTYSKYSDALYQRLGKDIAAASPTAQYYNWSDDFSKMGIDPLSMLFDPGHFNVKGSALFSQFLAGFMTDTLSMTPASQTAENANAWRAAAERWSAA